MRQRPLTADVICYFNRISLNRARGQANQHARDSQIHRLHESDPLRLGVVKTDSRKGDFFEMAVASFEASKEIRFGTNTPELLVTSAETASTPPVGAEIKAVQTLGEATL